MAVISRRAWRRAAVLALLAAGAGAAPDLDLRYAAGGDAEVEAEVMLTDPAGPPEVVAREWMAPLEAAARTLPGFAATAGEVSTGGGWLRFRFVPGTDVEMAARLLRSHLRGLARRRPANVEVRTLGGAPAALQAILALPGTLPGDTARDLARAIEGSPSVQRVDLYGGWRDETVVRARSASAALGGVETAVQTWQQVQQLGALRQGGRRWSVTALYPAGRLQDVPAALPSAMRSSPMRLGDLASIDTEREPLPRQIHLQGRPALGLAVTAAAGASPGRFERDLRQALAARARGVEVEVLRDDAAEVRRMLLFLALGVTGATLLAGAAGWRASGRGGAVDGLLAGPAAVAAALLACRAGRVAIDLPALAAVAAGIAAALPSGLAGRLAVSRPLRLHLTSATVALAVPAALLLSGSAEMGALVRPARIFFLTVAAALAGISLLPRTVLRKRLPWPPLLASALRQPEAGLAGGTAVIVLAILLFFGQLAPTSGGFTAQGADMAVTVGLPPGAGLTEMEQGVASIELALGRLPMVRRFSSLFDAQHATIAIDVAPSWNSQGRRQLLLDRLRLELPDALASSLRLAGGADEDRAVPASPTLEDEPATDEDATYYRCVLRSADLPRLRLGYSDLAQTLLAHQVSRHRLKPLRWPTSLRRELAPNPGVPPAELLEIAAALRARTEPLARLPFPGQPERSLVVTREGTTLDPSQAPPRDAVLHEPVLTAWGPVYPAALLRAIERVDTDRISRQAGRFVLPIEIQFPSNRLYARRYQRADLDGVLARAALPPGVELWRPTLGIAGRLGETARRILPPALLLVLWLGIAAVRLPNGAALLATLLPAAAGVAAASLAAALSSQAMDPLALLFLAGGLVPALPVALEMAEAAASVGGEPAARRLGALRAIDVWEPWLGWAGVAALCLLAVPALLSAGTQSQSALHLAIGAAALSGSLLAALYLVPGGLTIAAGQRRRRSAAYRALARPAAWEVEGPAALIVRRLGKTYPGGFTALAGVSFELEPGIVGILGPNGAGKTTLMRSLAGVMRPSRGRVLFNGLAVSPENAAAYRRRIGFLPQELSAYPNLTARRFLEHWAVARGMRRGAALDLEISGLLAGTGLLDQEQRLARDFSGGMLRRLGIASALLRSPAMVIVDEPTAGLDFEARAQFRALILAVMRQQKRILLLSTHVASDIQAVAAKVLVLHRGRLRFDGSVAGLIALAHGRVFEDLLDNEEIDSFKTRYHVTSRVQALDGVRVRAIAPPEGEPRGRIVEPTLEEAYLALLRRDPPASRERR